MDAATDSLFAFFERLFSHEGRIVRRVAYFWIGVIVLIVAVNHYHWALAAEWHVLTATVARWLHVSDHRSLAYGSGALALSLVAYLIWRRRQVRRGIKSPPWILIILVTLGALGLSVTAGVLLYRFAPDQNAKFDAAKTALTMFAGAAGISALILSFRTHFNGETDRLNMQFDAAAQKLTDSSTVVQTAGLLALQRIARRQAAYGDATAHVLFAYLSTTPGSEASPDREESPKRAALAREILNELK